jgi:hypothetical protein
VPIVASDIKYYLSGGAANSDPNASLGGARSSTEVVTATLHNLFDIVSSAEASAGMTDYRCIYVRNEHGSLTWQSVVTWLQQQADHANVTISIGLGTSAVDGTEQTIADENTAPNTVTFSEPANEGAGLSIGDLATNEHKAIWVRRVVTAGAAADDLDSAILRAKGDTAE